MKERNPGKVLIIRMSALGDVAMTLPVIYSVCQAYPDTEFTLLTRPFFAKIFINPPKNLSFVTADFKTEYKGNAGIYRLIKKLSSYNFTAVADLHNVLRSWIIDTYFVCRGVKVRMVDKERNKRKEANKQKKAQRSYIQRYCDVFKKLGYPVDLNFKSVFEASIIPAPDVVKHPAVGIAPYARYSNKTYPIGLMKKVVGLLTSKGINVYLYGARGKEAETLDSWQKEYENCYSLAGKMPITDELAMMNHMDTMVSMDSANQHLASVAGVKVLSIWGSTAPSCGFMAYGQSPDNVIMSKLACQPCTTAGSEICRLGNLECLKSLKPEFLAQRIEREIL